jgi:NAD(P)-dependent dehydrogenase (short-subunit alcohol dehydrogenase family)
MACRSVENAEAAAKEISDATRDLPGAGTVHVVKLDLGSLASVRQCAKELLQTEGRINLLVNNAGRVLGSRRRTVLLLSKASVSALVIWMAGEMLLC